jgi:rod shape-determining protein MreC
MQKLIDFVVKYREYITFVSLAVICLSLISMGNINKIGGFRTAIFASVAKLQDMISFDGSTGNTNPSIKVLRELNLQLSSEVTRMRNAIVENKKFRELLGLDEIQINPVIPAQVVGKTSLELRYYITIDKGAASGIKMGMAVRDDRGLIGTVIGTSENYSFIELIRNRDIRIAAKDQRTNINGIVVWEGGKHFRMKNILKTYDVRVGDIIITSNFSNKYPHEVPIGIVANIEEEEGEIFMLVEIEPFVDFNTLEYVFVVNMIPDPERLKLIEEIDAKITNRKALPKHGR